MVKMMMMMIILAIIGGVLTYLFKRYRNVILMRLLNTVMDWIDVDERRVSMESETDPSTSESTLVKERLRVNQNSDISTSSLSSHMWNNRLSTDAQKYT